MRSSQVRARSIAACSALRQDGAPIRPEKRQPGGEHQRVVLRHHQVLQRRHAGKQPDVLEGARDPGELGNPEIVQPFELDGMAVIMREPHRA